MRLVEIRQISVQTARSSEEYDMSELLLTAAAEPASPGSATRLSLDPSALSSALRW